MAEQDPGTGAPPAERSLAGRAAFVSGATSGIGEATALALARRGARVLVVGRRAERAEAVATACRALGAEARACAADVTDPGQLQAAVTATVAAFGALDIAFNNAGFQERKAPLLEQDDADFDQVFATNVRALFQAMKLQLALMLPRGRGVIVNNASVSGVRNPNPGFALYSASKAAVLSLTRAAAMEYAPQGIRINAVSPGRVVTPMMLAAGVADPAAVAAGLPIRRMGEPAEVAEAVAWLASDAASFVVGHNLCVDGGFLAG